MSTTTNNKSLSLWVGIGLFFGVALSLIFDNLIFLAIGLVLGILIGGTYATRRGEGRGDQA